MAEDTKKTATADEAKEIPVEPIQESQLPSDEQQTAEVEPERETSEGLPEDASERTRREFDKLTGSNKELADELREERIRREYYESLFSSMKQQEPEPESIIDPNTGLPSEQVLTDIQRKAQDASQRAERAEKAIQNIEREQENRTVYQAFPELNPDGKSFNKDLHVLTKSIALQSMVEPGDFGGKQLSFMEAVVKAKEMLGLEKQQAAKEAIESLEPKEQASLEAQGSSGRRQPDDLDELRRVSRAPGDKGQEARIKRFESMTQE